MLCPHCGKESNNQRVCAHCQTPYPAAMAAEERRARASGGLDALLARVTPRVKWGIVGVVALAVAGWLWSGRERDIPVGVAMPSLITAPNSLTEAEAFLQTAQQSAALQTQGGTLYVQVRANLPEQRKGLLAYAQQYSRADSIVSGARRVIVFTDPLGHPFAKADPAVGVVLTR